MTHSWTSASLTWSHGQHNLSLFSTAGRLINLRLQLEVGYSNPSNFAQLFRKRAAFLLPTTGASAKTAKRVESAREETLAFVGRARLARKKGKRVSLGKRVSPIKYILTLRSQLDDVARWPESRGWSLQEPSTM